jgi:hypothetical protein
MLWNSDGWIHKECKANTWWLGFETLIAYHALDCQIEMWCP